MVNSEPFNNYDLNEVFGVNLPAMIAVVQTLHTCGTGGVKHPK